MKPLPLVTAALVLGNLAAYALELRGGVEAMCDAHGFVPAQFMATGAVGPLLASLFLHAGLEHLLANMVALVVAGIIVEREIGHFRFLGLYLAAGVVGGLLHVVVDPTATSALVGASGAIFGVLAVAGGLRPRMLGFIVGFVGINVWYAFAGTGGDISFGTHLGGFAVGVLMVASMRLAARRVEAV
jgi:membrane associated rhomboid family serine protease